MPIYAATATTNTHPGHALTALLLLTLLVVTVGYCLGCWLFPFTRCRTCRGTGKRHSPTGRRFALCRPCDGTGYRLRIGRALWNRLNH